MPNVRVTGSEAISTDTLENVLRAARDSAPEGVGGVELLDRDAADPEGVDVVVSLGGRSIATRWTASARAEIRASRLAGTALLARTLAGMADGPTALVQASAIGYYGPRRPGEKLVEDSGPGEGFLAEVVRDWEDATTPAREAGLRVALLRTGLVLSDGGGSLLPQLPLFLAGVGGRLTARDAAVSWISLDDMVRAYAHVILSRTADGPLNAVAPGTVTAGEFARTLGRVLHRPALLHPRRRTGARARPRRGRRADPHRPGRLGRPAAQERLRACSPRARARAAPPAAADADEGGGVAQAGLGPATDGL